MRDLGQELLFQSKFKEAVRLCFSLLTSVLPTSHPFTHQGGKPSHVTISDKWGLRSGENSSRIFPEVYHMMEEIVGDFNP